jgi:hypothetical protein
MRQVYERKMKGEIEMQVGYILQPQVLLQESTPAMIWHMKQDGVNVVVLVPG